MLKLFDPTVLSNYVSTKQTGDTGRFLSRNFAWLTFVILILIGVAYIGGLFIPLMNNDSAHHANIALHMIETGDYISLVDRGQDYLDKPHLSFWLSAISFKLFGVTSFAFKLPSFLFSILALYSTYKLTSTLYSNRTAELSAMILATTYAFFLANNDVRMDAILTGCIIFSIWQLVSYNLTKSILSLLLSALGMAAGFSTKGAIGIVMPLVAIFFFIAYKRNWKDLFDWRWALLALMVVLFLTPVFYCFYMQFDLHPEKIIRGTTNNSGIAFLLFGQSIQRYSGSGWGTRAGSDPFFFLHTFLWAFIPWSIVTAVALWDSVRWQIRNKLRYSSTEQFFVPATVLLLILILSGSGFKLPHYLNIVFPLLAICAANFIERSSTIRKKWIVIIQYFTITVLLLLAVILNVWAFPISNIYIIIASTLLTLLFILVLVYNRDHYVTLTLTAIAILYLQLNFNFFPQLLQLQAGNVLAQTAAERRIPAESIRYLVGHETSNSFDFYVGRLIPEISLSTVVNSRVKWTIYTGTSGLKELDSAGIRYKIIEQAADFRITKINGNFLNPHKRKPTQLHYLICINRP